MFERFTDRARGVLVQAQQLAADFKSPAIRRHHVLIALVDASEGSVAAVLDDADVDLAALRARLVESLLASETALTDAATKVPFTAETKKALELSLREALSLGHNYIGREHLLLGVLRDPAGPLAAVLAETNLSHERARKIVASVSPPSVGSPRRQRFRARRAGGLAVNATPGLAKALARVGERDSGKNRQVTTGDFLVALLETPGTHFHAALAGVTLPDVVSVTAQVDRLIAEGTPDGLDDALRVDADGGVTIKDQRIAEALKNIVGDGPVTPETLQEVLRRLQGR